MRLFLLPLLLAASSVLAQTPKPDAPPSKEVVQYLDRFQQLIQKRALYADSIDWTPLRKEVQQKAQGLTSVAQCQPVLDHILRTLRNAGDKHSFLIPKDKAASWTGASAAGPPVESRYLGEGIGYLKVPTLHSMNATAGLTYSQELQRQLTALESQHPITGWVIDLRHNMGGNMHPMLEGLQALLGQEPYGYFLMPRRKREVQLRLRTGKGKQLSTGAAAATTKPVAVLTDSLTGSSGEMVAIALKGLRRARFFGQPTAGYTTTNMRHPLSDGAYLLLAEGYMADRNRKPYGKALVPDVVVEYGAQDAPDQTIEAAPPVATGGAVGVVYFPPEAA